MLRAMSVLVAAVVPGAESNWWPGTGAGMLMSLVCTSWRLRPLTVSWEVQSSASGASLSARWHFIQMKPASAMHNAGRRWRGV